MTLLLLLFACQQAPQRPPVDPHVVSGWVVDALEEVAVHARDEPTSALDAMTRAHDLFDGDLEPALRARWSDKRVAQAEYRFARMQVTLVSRKPQAAAPIARELAEALRDVLPPPDAVAVVVDDP
jgi:hypothetical protein